MLSWCSPEGGSWLLLLYYALENFKECWLVRCFIESFNFGFVWFFFIIRLKLQVGFYFLKESHRRETPLSSCHIWMRESHMVAPLTLTFAVGRMASARCSLMLLLAGRPPLGMEALATHPISDYSVRQILLFPFHLLIHFNHVNSCLFSFCLGL